jgi:hypothetical protein
MKSFFTILLGNQREKNQCGIGGPDRPKDMGSTAVIQLTFNMIYEHLSWVEQIGTIVFFAKSPHKLFPICRVLHADIPFFSNQFINSKTLIPSFTPPSLGLWNKCSCQYWPIGASSASQHCRPCPANEVESGKNIFLRIKMQIKIQKIS